MRSSSIDNRTRIPTHAHIHIHVQVHKHIHVYMYRYLYICLHICIHINRDIDLFIHCFGLFRYRYTCPQNNAEHIGLVSQTAERRLPTMSTLSSYAWERRENGRYFHMSRAAARRLRHGSTDDRVDLVMDSAGWVNAKSLLHRFWNTPRDDRLITDTWERPTFPSG